jgi:hypothetical protein
MRDASPGNASNNPGFSHTTAVAHHTGSPCNPDPMPASPCAILVAWHSDNFYGNNIADLAHWASGITIAHSTGIHVSLCSPKKYGLEKQSKVVAL